MTALPSSHPDYSRQRRLALLFNLTLEDYDTLLKHQRGRCAVCKKFPKVGGNRLSVDHNHVSGLVRGLLCWNCNRALGRLKDNLELIEALAEFLRNPPATTALGGERYGRVGRVTKKAAKRKRITRKPKK